MPSGGVGSSEVWTDIDSTGLNPAVSHAMMIRFDRENENRT